MQAANAASSTAPWRAWSSRAAGTVSDIEESFRYVVGGDAGPAYMRMVLILARARRIPHHRVRFHTSGKGDCNAVASFWGDFHDRERFYVLGRIKVFAIMESAGVLHDREDFCPISG